MKRSMTDVLRRLRSALPSDEIHRTLSRDLSAIMLLFSGTTNAAQHSYT